MTVLPSIRATESRKGRKVQVFIAGDDETAKAKVSDLVKAAEFEPIDSGTLYNSRFLEPIGEMNICWASSWVGALLERQNTETASNAVDDTLVGLR
jgi:predicted dinucleotide-binding enzyme